MSLDWSVERVKNHDVLTTLVVNQGTDETGPMQRKWLPLTEALVWATMHVGINSITEDNWKDFYFRLNAWEKLLGPQLRVWGTASHPVSEHYKRFITPLEVYMHKGLYTNASTLTKNQFLKKLAEIHERENKSKLENVKIDYLGADLDTIDEATYQRIWKHPNGYTLNEKLSNYHASITPVS